MDAHVNTCLYTSDKVAAGLREYELMLSTKPLVSRRSGCQYVMIRGRSQIMPQFSSVLFKAPHPSVSQCRTNSPEMKTPPISAALSKIS